MKRNLLVTGLVAVIIAGFVLAARFWTGSVVPPVDGYMEGRNIRFIHTEASDAQVAQLLTKMKGSPVLVVPSLAQAPQQMLANVYVFKNGIAGGGPLDFQPDVFDSPPGTEGYRPLRRLNLVTWKNPQAAREFRTAAEVREALAQGEITIEQPGVVVNMPLLTWPGGHR
ncbi:DUF7482 domain-containing protein [Aromatoleum toluclasticum]|uniref:DUF7482 domain-containing protein n=1 Tax=Aromatoleum toluclasticum TaxID=92003 RepID=UPI00036EAC86|nr:hypothetical protein [Aromatoleum toluclasticum]